MRFIHKLFFLGMLSSCSPNSLEDFHYEGQALCKRLVQELQDIHNPEQLMRAAPKLKKKFNSLVVLIIRAREYQETHPEEEAPSHRDRQMSCLLQEQLRRIYAIEGGREVIERSQQEALVQLDAFERACIKKKQIFRRN